MIIIGDILAQELDTDEPTISVFNYTMANFRRYKLRYGLTIFGLIVCIVFFIIIASLSIGLYEPTEPEITPGDVTEEETYTPEEVLELDNNVKRTIVNWLYATSVLIFATAIAGVANTMLMSMIERKREIGILKSVGITRRKIMELFFAECFTLCMIAFIIGVILGIYLANNVFNYLDFEGRGSLFFASMRTPPVVIFAAFVIVFVVGGLSGILPAYRAAKLSPMEALRK